MNEVQLFTGGTVQSDYHRRVEAMSNEIATLRLDQLSEEEVEELCHRLDEEYRIRPAALAAPEEIRVAAALPARVDARFLPGMWAIPDQNKPFMVPGVIQRAFIPFAGDPATFRWAPNISGPSKPWVERIDGNEIVFVLASKVPLTPEELRHAVLEEYNSIQRWLAYVYNESIGTSLVHEAKRLIQERLDIQERSRANVEGAGFRFADD